MTKREIPTGQGEDHLAHRVALDEDAILTLAAAETGDEDLLLEAALSQLDDEELDGLGRWLDALDVALDEWVSTGNAPEWPDRARYVGQS